MKKLMESEFRPNDKVWLSNYMSKLGFKKHASGWDKIVWVNEDGEIMLAVGPLNDERNEVFVEWINFCNQHKGRKFLPKIEAPKKITNPETGTSVLIAASERLFEMSAISDHVGQALEFFTSEADYASNKSTFLKAVKDYIRNPEALEYTNKELAQRRGRIFFSRLALEIASGLEYLILHMGASEIYGLASMIYDVVKEGERNNFTNDLHSGNFMISQNGDMVINDPWVKYGQSRSTGSNWGSQ